MSRRQRRPICIEIYPSGWAWTCRRCDTYRGWLEATFGPSRGPGRWRRGHGLPTLAAAADAGCRHLEEVHNG